MFNIIELYKQVYDSDQIDKGKQLQVKHVEFE